MSGIIVSPFRRCANAIGIDFEERWDRLKEVPMKNWHLGMTAFGGPPVHFQIVRLPVILFKSWHTDHLQFHKKFVEKYEWIDEQFVCTLQTRQVGL